MGTRLRRRDFQARVRKVIALYAAGEGSTYTHEMDALTMACSDAQWRAVTLYLEQVDAWLAETDVGTAYQKEKAAAKREGRRSRYPTVFDTGTPEADARIAALKAE